MSEAATEKQRAWLRARGINASERMSKRAGRDAGRHTITDHLWKYYL